MQQGESAYIKHNLWEIWLIWMVTCIVIELSWLEQPTKQGNLGYMYETITLLGWEAIHLVKMTYLNHSLFKAQPWG